MNNATVAQSAESGPSKFGVVGSSPARRSTYSNEANAGADRIGERVAVGDGSCVVDALISAKPRTGTTRRIKPEISAGRFANVNGRNAQVDAPATAVPVLCSRHTREIDTRPSTHSHAAHHSRVGLCAVSTGGVSLFNAAVLADQNPHLRAHATKHGQQTDAANTCASREKFARVVGYAQAIPASPAAPFSISALVHGPLFERTPVGTSATTESHT